jgi:hypothetical protein
MVANYLRLIIFAAGLLVGVQVPGFVDQYAKRVSAHAIEARENFRGFQEIADKYFKGDVEALIAHHAASEDRAFKDEATSIRAIYDRLLMLTAELAALRGSLPAQIAHVAFRPNRELFLETRAAYSYTVPLSPPAIVSGIAFGALLALLAEGLLGGVFYLVRPRRHRQPHAARVH